MSLKRGIAYPELVVHFQILLLLYFFRDVLFQSFEIFAVKKNLYSGELLGGMLEFEPPFAFTDNYWDFALLHVQ